MLFKDTNIDVSLPIHKVKKVDLSTNVKIEFTKTDYDFSWELFAVSYFCNFFIAISINTELNKHYKHNRYLKQHLDYTIFVLINLKRLTLFYWDMIVLY